MSSIKLRILLLIVCPILLSGCASSGVSKQDHKSNADTWKKANEAYTNREWDQAESLYQNITNAFPNDSEALFRLGVSAFRQGKLKLAEESFTQVLRLEPGNTKATFNLGVMQLNSAYKLFMECARNATSENERTKYMKLAKSIAELQWMSGQ